MQILGIGTTRENLNSIVKKLQKNLSHQLNSGLFDDPRLSSAVEIEDKEIQNIIIDIIKIKPDWIIILPEYFKNSWMFLKLIDGLKSKSDKKLHLVMVIENLKQSINSFLQLIPEFELVNKMNLKLSTSELILEHNIKSFPRIRLNSEFQKINYTNNFGELVSHTSEEIPVNSILSFKDIVKFETNVGEFKPRKWLEKILKKKDMAFQLQNVTSILCEKKGCYLFPGIPFNSILNIKFNKIKIEHLILQDECKVKNLSFKRLIKSMQHEYQDWLRDKKDFHKEKYLPIFCLMKQSLVRDILENLFYEMGQANVKMISEINYAKNVLKKPCSWLKLEELPSSVTCQRNIDWSFDLIQILEPLKNFVDLNELTYLKNSKYLPLHKIEFEKFKKNIFNEENEINNIINQVETDKMLFGQELDILKKLNLFAKLLMKVLAYSRTWEDAHKRASKIKQLKILLLCEEENHAAELNLKLRGVERKLWINPLKFKKPEDLIQLNTKMTKSYFNPKCVVINSDAKNHLENLCRQTNKEFEKAKIYYKEINLIIKHSKTDLSLIQKNKKNLVLRWLNVSFKQLLYRDRHLFKSISEEII